MNQQENGTVGVNVVERGYVRQTGPKAAGEGTEQRHAAAVADGGTANAIADIAGIVVRVRVCNIL
jgi:hypothetical protein